jgi:hypothetical protein
MGVPTSEVGYISAITGKGDREVHKGHVVALGKKTYLKGKGKGNEIPEQALRVPGG